MADEIEADEAVTAAAGESDETAEVVTAKRRRRASRAAGPVGDAVTVSAEAPSPDAGRAAARVSPVGRPPRRAPNGERVAIVAAAAVLAATVVVGALVAILGVQHRHDEAVAAHDQRFVDTAAQTVVNMFSYTDQTVEESVDRFVAGTSGPLRDIIAGNAENLKELFRATRIATSEVVINAAALEGIDEDTGDASVLVATRVTTTGLDGVTKPSLPYRMRVIVHQDDEGRMTAYDLKYPDGGN